VQAHQAEGKTSAVIPVIDLYDEFNFGERSPFAIRQFLQTAKQNWQKPPSYLLLNGRASLDPRNYLGFGNLDLVPTRIVQSSSLMTASDDWFSDFTNNGMPTIATGRLPVSTLDDATTVVGKIVAYNGASTNGPWTGNALMVADVSDTENFAQDSLTVQSHLPANLQVTDVFSDTVGTTAARGDIVNAINAGQLLVNYLGHGSEEQWSGSDIFDENTVPSLTNTSQLPVFLIMDCLNGFFQDVYAQPLGVTLMLAPNGGGVAVLASSGLNQPAPQIALDALILQNALNAQRTTLGESVVKAKSKITDPDVRRTFILFGDPAMQVKQAPAASKTN
jgi:Peptidase family C25